MQRIIYECDRCHQEIPIAGTVLEEFQLQKGVVVRTGRTRHLCSSCELDLTEWLDAGLQDEGPEYADPVEETIDSETIDGVNTQVIVPDDPNYREVTMVEDENGNLYDPGAEPTKAYVKPGTLKPGQRKPIDMPKALAMREAKKPMKEIAEAMGVSIPTMRARFKKVDRAMVSDGQA